MDLFAGSGGLGIEALSRGVDKAVFVDLEPKSIETIRANLKATKLEDQAAVYRNDAGRALKALAKRGTRFDLVFLDPPYRMKNGDELMQTMHDLELLEPEATIVLEYESKYEYPERFGPFGQTRKSVYGETAVSIYRYEPNEAETKEDITEEAQPHD